MKKQLFSLMFIAFMALTASAQIHTTVFSVADSISINSAAFRTYTTGISGIYSHQYLYRKVGDTVFTATPAILTGTNPLWRRVYGLNSSTDYEVRAVVIKNGISDTSASVAFPTNDTLLPNPLSITNIMINAGVSQTLVNFHYKFVPYQADVNFWYDNYNNLTNAIRLTGEGDTSIVVTNPNVPNTAYNNNILFAVVVGNVPGIDPDSEFVAPNYVVPGQQSADVEYATITAIGEDSLVLTAKINTGNTGMANVKMDFLNNAGVIIQSLPVFTITHDTIVNWKKTGLQTFTNYAFRVKAWNVGGTDSIQTNARTKQVPLATFINPQPDTITAGFSSTKVEFTASTNGLWPGSTSKFWPMWVDSLGAIRTGDTIFGITGQQQRISSLLDKLRENPQTNYIDLYLANAAGVTSQQMQITLPRRKAGFTLSWGSAQPTGFTTGTVTNLTYTIPAGTTGTGIVKLTKIAPVTASPVLKLAGSNLTGSGTISLVSLTGLDTGATYSVQLLGASQDQDTVTNSDIRYITTWSVKGPKIGAFAATVIYVDSIKVVSIDTLGNTGPMQLDYVLCDSNEVPLRTQSFVTSTAISARSVSEWNLDPGTKYVWKHKVSALNALPDTARIVVYTAGIPNSGVSVTSVATQTIDSLHFAISTNGNWAGSVADSLIVFDGTTLIASVYRPIGSQSTGNYLLVKTGFTPGSTHIFNGYVRNHAGGITTFTITVTFTAPDAAATATLGLADAYPARIVLRNCTYNVPVNSADYKVLRRMAYPSTTVWDSIPQGIKSGAGNFADITIAPLDVLSSYEIKIWCKNNSGVIWETPVLTVATLEAKDPKIQFVNLVDNTPTTQVEGTIVSQSNGSNSEVSEGLYFITGGQPNLVEQTGPVGVGTDASTVPFSHPLSQVGYYEDRAKIAKVGDINPDGESAFFNNISTGNVQKLTFDDIRPLIKSSAYTQDGKLLASNLLPKELVDLFPEDLIIIVPDNVYYAKKFGGKTHKGVK